MNINNFKERDLKNVIKIVCDQEFFRELVDFPNMVLKDHTHYYKGIPISIDENLKYKTCELLYKNDSNFYDGIVKNLKQEAKHLNERLTRFRVNNEMNGYISTLKSLRETLDLIKKYDWQLMYSEYGIKDEKEIMRIDDSIDDIIDISLANNKTRNEIKDEIDYLIRQKGNSFITEIAVWEQNNEGNIRNHKVWRTNIPYKKGVSIKDKDGFTALHIGNGELIIKGDTLSIIDKKI